MSLAGDRQLARAAADAIRVLAIDAVERAKSGHPGMPMGMADIAEVLWRKYLKHDPAVPDWVNRDRFVLSNGHGSMLLYAVLHLSEARPGEQRASNVATTFDHVAFECTDFEAMRAHLARMNIDCSVAEVPGKTQKQIFFSDPAGNGIELNFAV